MYNTFYYLRAKLINFHENTDKEGAKMNILIIFNSIIFVRWLYRFHEIHGANLCAFPHYSVEVCKELPELVETVYS